jgi:hypothetical protein
MAQKTVPDFEQHWIYVYNSLQSEYSDIVTKYPDAEESIKQVGRVFSDIVSLAGCTPSEVGDSMKWQGIVSATTDRLSYCKSLKGKQLFRALYGLYTITSVLQSSVKHKNNPGADKAPNATTDPSAEFKEQRRRTRNKSSEDGIQSTPKKMPTTAKNSELRTAATRNCYAPLRSEDMETRSAWEGGGEADHEGAVNFTGRPPPIVLTSAVNLIKSEKDIRSKVKGDFHLKTTRNGVRVVTREMADYLAIKRHFDLSQLGYFTFHPKSEKPIKAVIRHLPSDTPAEDISQELTALGFNVISVRQMTTSRS